MFFDEADIKKEYSVMGIMKNEGTEFEESDPESVQRAFVTKAKAVGADAILFVGFYNEKQNGEYTDVSYDKNGSSTSTYKSSSKIFEAKLLKFK